MNDHVSGVPGGVDGDKFHRTRADKFSRGRITEPGREVGPSINFRANVERYIVVLSAEHDSPRRHRD